MMKRMKGQDREQSLGKD